VGDQEAPTQHGHGKAKKPGQICGAERELGAREAFWVAAPNEDVLRACGTKPRPHAISQAESLLEASSSLQSGKEIQICAHTRGTLATG